MAMSTLQPPATASGPVPAGQRISRPGMTATGVGSSRARMSGAPRQPWSSSLPGSQMTATLGSPHHCSQSLTVVGRARAVVHGRHTDRGGLAATAPGREEELTHPPPPPGVSPPAGRPPGTTHRPISGRLGGPGATVTRVGLQPGSAVVASFRRRRLPPARPVGFPIAYRLSLLGICMC
jgi:hypothetical protein